MPCKFPTSIIFYAATQVYILLLKVYTINILHRTCKHINSTLINVFITALTFCAYGLIPEFILGGTRINANVEI